MRLVVSFTTIPSRIDRIRPMVDSILAQTVKPDRLVLWLPTRCGKENVEYVIPNWMRSLSFEIANCGCDYGPATKLIPSLLSEPSPETRIVTLDDDVAYEKHALEELSLSSIGYPDRALGFMGCTSGPTYVHAESVTGFVDVDVLGGYRGVIYRRALFDGSIFRDLATLMENGLFVCDDQLISWNLLRRSIARTVIKTAYPGEGGSLNFRFLGLGSGIYEGDKHLATESIERLKALYDENGWRRSA